MDFELSERCNDYRERVRAFMDEHVIPAEVEYHEAVAASGDPHHVPPLMGELKAQAREQGLWNLFHPHEEWGPGLSNVEYAPLAEIMGRSLIAPEVFNCQAPDTGNLEV